MAIPSNSFPKPYHKMFDLSDSKEEETTRQNSIQNLSKAISMNRMETRKELSERVQYSTKKFPAVEPELLQKIQRLCERRRRNPQQSRRLPPGLLMHRLGDVLPPRELLI